MNIHQIDIQGGYSGTVEILEGDLKIEFPFMSLQDKIKLYNIHLLTPDRKNIELNLILSDFLTVNGVKICIYNFRFQ